MAMRQQAPPLLRIRRPRPRHQQRRPRRRHQQRRQRPARLLRRQPQPLQPLSRQQRPPPPPRWSQRQLLWLLPPPRRCLRRPLQPLHRPLPPAPRRRLRRAPAPRRWSRPPPLQCRRRPPHLRPRPPLCRSALPTLSRLPPGAIASRVIPATGEAARRVSWAPTRASKALLPAQTAPQGRSPVPEASDLPTAPTTPSKSRLSFL
mmetsp:Transcript_4335/g.9923  ORF Transcript_4335/g.9923 Transcript_4335/m.9923 type:complete len:204 (-) Transcript_4335:869-1480(-)